MQLIAWSSENIKNNIPLELILNSFLIGFIVALAASVIAIILSLGSFKSSNRLIFDLSTIGYAIPGSVLAVSLLLVFSFYFGLSITVFGIWGLFLCLLIRFITPLIRYLDAALSSMTEETLSATMIYSRSLLKTFRSIYFPALYPSVLFGFLVVFIEVIKEQPATLLLRPVGFDTLSSKIYNFTSEGQWELAATPSIAMLTNDVNKIDDGSALYSVITNNEGGIIDDLIVYKFNNEKFRVVSNCSTFDDVNNFFESNIIKFDCKFIHNPSLGILAIQGPESEIALENILEIELSNYKSFSFTERNKLFISRTGYTGEDGFEVIGEPEELQNIWDLCISKSIPPIGLGARDTLRVEAGMNLNGTDMTIKNNPFESNLGWVVDFSDDKRDFIAKENLTEIKNTNRVKLVGVLLNEKGVLRSGQKIIKDDFEGEVTSGTFSPYMKKSIGLARLPMDINRNANVLIRNKLLNVKILSIPFIRKGKIMI